MLRITCDRKINLTKEKLLVFCFLFSLLISIWAVRTPNSTLGSNTLRAFLTTVFYALLIIEYVISFFSVNIRKTRIVVLLTALWPVLYWIYIHIWTYEMESLALTSPIIAFLFALQSIEIKKQVFCLYKRVLIIVSFIGIVCYLAYALKISIPYSVVPYYDGRPYQYYVNYFNIAFLYINSIDVRLCGIFNEPGWLGTNIGLLLCYDEFDTKKISNWILLVAGFFSFSIAFFLILIIGYILRNIIRIKKCILIAVSLCFFLFFIQNINMSNPQLNHLVSRLQVTSEGLAGDNRSSLTLDRLLSHMIFSSDIFFGYGDGYAEYINSTEESKQVLTIKTELINFGFIGMFVLYVVPFFFFLKLGHANNKAICFIICFWISLYQRPWLYTVSNYMILLSTVAYLNEGYRNQNFRSVLWKKMA